VGHSDGGFTVIETQQWTQVLSKRKARRRITCVKYSPDGRFLAVGSADNRIQFYDVASEMGSIGQTDGSSSVILGIDWSEDSKYCQTATQAYELLFYEVTKTTVTPVTKSRDLKDIKWATQSITLGWTVQGIWPKFSDGSDVNNVNRSNSQKYLASAEDSGTVRLFNYPCIGSGLDKEGALSRRPKSFAGRAHSSHVTNVAWLFNDSYVISAGGADLTVMQWKVEAV
jgi:WD40 repeat protein